MTEIKYMVQLKSKKVAELAGIEVKRAHSKLVYAARLLEEVKQITELLEELLENENSL